MKKLFGRFASLTIPFVLVMFLAPSTLYSESDRKAQQPSIQNLTGNSDTRPQPAGLYDPIANPKAVVIFEHARFTVLTSQLIRMEWAADGKFEDHASLVFLNRNLPMPAFRHQAIPTTSGHQLSIETDALRLVYTVSNGSDGKFTPDDLQVSLKLDSKEVVWHPGMPDTGNLQGTTRTLDGARGSNTRESIGPGLISRNGWVVVDDSSRPLFDSTDFRFAQGEKSPWPWVMERPAGERQDWYFFGYGHDYKQALGDFVRVAGRIPLPPHFAFGAWWSRYWDYSDQELVDLVRGFRENDTPLDVLVIDMGWHISRDQLEAAHETDQSGQSLGWTGYSWNKLLFPDPAAFLSKIHQDGLKATLNMHPASGVQPWEIRYPEMARAMGIDPSTKKYVPFDITNKKYATNLMDIMLHPLEKQGIDFWWLDWQQQPNTNMAGVSPTWWLNYVHFTDQAREGKRPLLFHRWGGLGNHRYQIGFSGDTISVWPSLAFQPWFTATAANVGYAYWSHDIGGHMPGVVDPELYTRWIQFGAFSPILRTHTTKNPNAERRIWAYPEPYSGIMRQTFQLRYAMIPYIYTEARKTYDTGVSFLRPLYYNWPEANQAYTFKNEYQFGQNMIVAPITDAADSRTGLATESIWLPPGEWIEWQTGAHLKGPVELKRNFSIQQIPIYVPAGSIVPQAPPMLYSNQKPLSPLILTVFPLAPGSTSEYTLYEDAGDSRAYQQNQARWTPIAAKESGGNLTVRIGPGRGSYPGMLSARSYELRLLGDWPPSSVTVNGKVLAYKPGMDEPGWKYEGNTLTTVITIPSMSTTEQTVIQVHRPVGLIENRAELDGFAGKMTRLREAYDVLNQTFPLSWAPDDLVDAMQTGDRLTYRPQEIQKEMAHFRAVLPQALNSVEKMTAPNQRNRSDVAKRLSSRWKGESSQIIARYDSNANRAAALLQDIDRTSITSERPQ
ncbi:MAG TPA: TIM-barrel domain-containing protein [Acidobacteriaceae bacterium]|nr:TIM-barrel domain-containing protein [Acidobacteriaceae bacterium]